MRSWTAPLSVQCPQNVGKVTECTVRRPVPYADESADHYVAACANALSLGERDLDPLQHAVLCCDSSRLTFEEYEACQRLHAPLTGGLVNTCFDPCPDARDFRPYTRPYTTAKVCASVTVVAAFVAAFVYAVRRNFRPRGAAPK